MNEFLDLIADNPILLIIIVGSVIMYFRNKKPVECQNCGAKMTRGKIKENKGCIRCGSDLFS